MNCAKQHKKPCATCPFTSRVTPESDDPGSTGYSPTEVYVAQYFMPYIVTCHEFVDYDDPNWKAKASNPPLWDSAMRWLVDVPTIRWRYLPGCCSQG